jgi:hypothetical protein
MMNDPVFITGGNCRATGGDNSLEGSIFPPVRQFRQSLLRDSGLTGETNPDLKTLKTVSNTKTKTQKKCAAIEPPRRACRRARQPYLPGGLFVLATNRRVCRGPDRPRSPWSDA